MSKNGYHIVGGGIVGASTAYHLARSTDAPVHVYEKSELASETTKKSLAFYGFYGGKTQKRMKKYGMELYNEFLKDSCEAPEYTATGRLIIATTDDGRTALRKKEDGEDADDVLSKFVTPDDLRSSMVLPFLNTDAVTCGHYQPQVGYVQPQELAFELIQRAKTHGAVFHEQTPVTDIQTKDGAVTGLTVDGKTQPSTSIIAAAGPWNLQLAKMVGIDLPVRHTLAPVLELEPPEPFHYNLPWIVHHESGFSIRRNADGSILMTHHPVGGYEVATEYNPDEQSDEFPMELRNDAIDTLESLLPYTAEFSVVDERVGIRSSTPDGNPIVGWTEVEGFSVAAFNTSGIQLAPAVGRILTQQLIKHNRTSYYDKLSVTRFENYDDWR